MKREIVGQRAVVVLVVAIVAAIVGGAIGYVLAPAAEVPPQQFKGMKVVWIGGAAGDPYDTLLMNGALDAGKYLGVSVEYVHTEWEPDKMVMEFSSAIGRRPDGIVLMGHPGYEGLVSLFETATDAGISIMMTDVDVPRLRDEFPGVGYIGLLNYETGYTVAKAGLAEADLSPGDRAVVISGSWDEPERMYLAIGAEDAYVEAGLIVDRVEHPSAVYGDPSAGIPYIVGYYGAHPDVKLIHLDGGATTASTIMYMEALGVGPGEIAVVGLDVTPGSLDALRAGYLMATVDCQPYVEGYMTVVNVCLRAKHGFSGIFANTARAVVTMANVHLYEDPARKGYLW